MNPMGTTAAFPATGVPGMMNSMNPTGTAMPTAGMPAPGVGNFGMGTSILPTPGGMTMGFPGMQDIHSAQATNPWEAYTQMPNHYA